MSSSSTSSDSPHSQFQFSFVVPIYRCKATTSSITKGVFLMLVIKWEGL